MKSCSLLSDAPPSIWSLLQKPSSFWPPPSHEVTRIVHSRLLKKIYQIVLLITESGKANDCISVADPSRHSMADSTTGLDEHGEDEPSGTP